MQNSTVVAETATQSKPTTKSTEQNKPKFEEMRAKANALTNKMFVQKFGSKVNFKN